MSDFIANSPDAEFLAEARQFSTILSANPAAFGSSPAEAAEYAAAVEDLDTEYKAHVAAQAEAKTRTGAKDSKRDTVENLTRKRLKQAKDTVAVATDLAALGQFATSSYTPVSNPTRPVGKVDTSQRLQHTISFADEATPDVRRKPTGTIGCQIYQKIGGAAPISVKECVFVALDTATPYLNQFEGEDAGKMVHYMLRWQLKDGSYSAWSETISATVAG